MINSILYFLTSFLCNEHVKIFNISSSFTLECKFKFKSINKLICSIPFVIKSCFQLTCNFVCLKSPLFAIFWNNFARVQSLCNMCIGDVNIRIIVNVHPKTKSSQNGAHLYKYKIYTSQQAHCK
jgi:hypothetical protein